MQFYFLETVNESAEQIFIHLAKEQEAIEDLNIPEDEKLAMEEKLEDNLLNNVDDEIIEAVQGNATINNIGDLQDVVETYSEKLDAIESLGAKYWVFSPLISSKQEKNIIVLLR